MYLKGVVIFISFTITKEKLTHEGKIAKNRIMQTREKLPIAPQPKVKQ